MWLYGFCWFDLFLVRTRGLEEIGWKNNNNDKKKYLTFLFIYSYRDNDKGERGCSRQVEEGIYFAETGRRERVILYTTTRYSVFLIKLNKKKDLSKKEEKKDKNFGPRIIFFVLIPQQI